MGNLDELKEAIKNSLEANAEARDLLSELLANYPNIAVSRKRIEECVRAVEDARSKLAAVPNPTD